MSLRLRLIAVFFLMSVVPLGALTLYTFLGNVAAMREAAEAEAQLLTRELGGRMETVMAQLTQRMGQLLESTSGDASSSTVAAPTAGEASPPGAPGTPNRADAVSTAPDIVAQAPVPDGQAVTDALSELSLLVNNIEVRGGRGRQGGIGGPVGRGNGRGSGVSSSARGAVPPENDLNRIRIDLEPIRLEMLRERMSRSQFESLSSDDRERIVSEVNQRMRDMQQGIQIVREKIAEELVRVQADARSSTGVLVTQRRSALTGSRLDVREERDGEVVSQVTGDVDLPVLLNAVFSATRYDRGEVPFAVSREGQLFTLGDEDRTTIEALGTPAVRGDTASGTTVLPEWVVVTTTDPTGSGLKFGIARPIGDALGGLRRATLRDAGIGLGFIGLALIAILPLSSSLTRNLSNLSEAVRRIAQGDYAARVAVRSDDEVGKLGQAFNQMAEDVERHQRSLVEQERIRRELELGRQIQHDMLPRAPLTIGLTDIRGVSVPAREVGGDFFNYFQLTNGTIALLVGDVSGKGVGAALLMANIQASLRTRLALGQDLASVARELDRDIASDASGRVYATLFVGIFDPASRELRWVNAGHNPQFVVREHGGLERLESTGLPIGLLPGRGYVEQRAQLGCGDLLFFYTDGCVEAENAAGEMFGLEQLEGLLAAAAGCAGDQLLVRAEDAVTRFRGGREPSDDATMMVVRVG